MLRLHRDLVEYQGMNREYVGESLSHQLPYRAYSHLLGFLYRFSEHYQWEPATAHECLAGLGSPADWLPFSQQLQGWVKSSHRGQHACSAKHGENTA